MTRTYLLGLLLALALLPGAPAQAQTAPGWAWVRGINAYSPFTPGSTYLKNSTAGVGRDAAGNLYVAGAFVGTLNIGPILNPPLAQDKDVFVAKYDPAGTLLWVRTLHSAYVDDVLDLVVSPSGRCLVAGTYGGGGDLSFASFGSSVVLPGQAQLSGVCAFLPFVAAINPNGTLAWATCPTPAAFCGVVSPTNYSVYGRNLATDAQDNVYWSALVGAVGAAFPANGRDAALLKFDANGQLQWTRRATAIGSGSSVQPTAVQTDQAGNVYWEVQNYNPFTLDNVTYGANSYKSLIKLTTATNQVQWVKDNLFQFVRPAGVMYDAGGYGFAGLDAAAGKLYFQLNTWGQDISFNSPGSPIVVVKSNQVGTQYLAQCDLNGQVQWVKLLANLTSSQPFGSDMNARVYPFGNRLVVLTNTVLDGTTAFVGNPTTFTAAQGGLLVATQFNPATGLTDWLYTAGTNYGANYYYPTSQFGTFASNAVVDPAGSVYVAGLYYGPATFGTTALGHTNFTYYSYLAKLNQSVLATKQAVAGHAWQPYPNPATGSVFLGGLPTGAQVSLLDALGRTVRRTSAATLGLGGVAPGLYLLQVTGTPEPYQSQRLTVE